MLALLLVFLASPLQHDLVRPLPGSRLVADDEHVGELVVTYRSAGSRVRRVIEGHIHSLEYEASRDVTAEDVVDYFTEQAKSFDGGRVHRSTENRLTFSFRRADGGTTWCQIWATDGNYTLELVDAPPPAGGAEPEPEEKAEPDTGTVLAELELDGDGDELPPGAGATIDAVVQRLAREPAVRLQLRASGRQARAAASKVRDALLLFGLAADRLDEPELLEGGGAETRVELVLVP